jgi:hypothetical protein
MFGIKIEGRLGNQMFQYAFAIALQQRLQTHFYIDGYKYHFINKYFVLDRYFTLSTKASLGNLARKTYAQFARGSGLPVVTEDQSQPPASFLEQYAKDGYFFKGFFQSEQYFSNVKDIIAKEFRIKDHLRVNIGDFTGNNHRETIVVHIRRTDYLNWGSEALGFNLSLPDTYYHRCLSGLDTTNKNILFLSDDIAYVKKTFNFPNAFYSEKNSEITDLQLLMQGDYLVLANSSFSWWGAFLNQQVKKILCPKYWIGFKINREWPNGVIPAGWEAINVL